MLSGVVHAQEVTSHQMLLGERHRVSGRSSFPSVSSRSHKIYFFPHNFNAIIQLNNNEDSQLKCSLLCKVVAYLYLKQVNVEGEGSIQIDGTA